MISICHRPLFLQDLDITCIKAGESCTQFARRVLITCTIQAGGSGTRNNPFMISSNTRCTIIVNDAIEQCSSIQICPTKSCFFEPLRPRLPVLI